MSNRLTFIIAGLLLLTLFSTAFLSMAQDSLTFDELAHIPASYSYLTQKDYRLNPEHPPLVKDLAALPLLFLNLNFPSKDQVWLQEDSAPAWWVQFDAGTKFLYESGNNPRDIIIWSRLPMIFLLVFLAWFLFKWARELGGNYAGLAVLILFSFSPEFIAHGRLVTTDAGAAMGTVLATYFWLKFLKNPKKINLFLAGLFLGIALLIKFSLILLIPFLGIITFVYALLSAPRLENLKKYIPKAVLAGAISLMIIWPIYQFHIWNYPPERQVRDTAADLAPNPIEPAKNLTIWMADKPLLRPFAQYFKGVLMATQRTGFGNTTYFMGQISADAWRSYFPIMYLAKLPLAFHAITILTILGLIYSLFRKRPKNWLKENFFVFAFLAFLSIYWLTAIMGNLNIGLRHILPTIPFIYFLVILGLRRVFETAGKFKKPLAIALALIFIWYAYSSVSAFPYYLSYYNEAAGGIKNGYKYAADSNYDWGQDFYRLLMFINENNIQKINLDYFGGESPKYWLGEKYIKLNPKESEKPRGWVAVSLNQLMGGIAKPVSGFDQETGYYGWLEDYTLKAKAGNSIFIYYKD